MQLMKYIIIAFALILTACNIGRQKPDNSNSFIVNMILDGQVPYGDSYSHTLSSLGRPDSIAAIYTDRTDTTKNTQRVYFKNSSFIKYGDSLKLDKIDLVALPGTFVTCNKLKLTDKSTPEDIKPFHAKEMQSELKAGEQAKYRLWGIPDSPGSESYWVFYFDKNTRRLLRMAHLTFS